MNSFWDFFSYFIIFQCGCVFGILKGKGMAYRKLIKVLGKGELEIHAFIEALKKKYL
jgi:hypothetical protein